MQITTPPHAAPADAVSPPLQHRRRHALVLVSLVAALGATAGLTFIDDPRPLDEQLSTAFGRATEALQGWQDQLTRGLQVSLRAVADGREQPPAPRAPGADRPAAVRVGIVQGEAAR